MKNRTQGVDTAPQNHDEVIKDTRPDVAIDIDTTGDELCSEFTWCSNAYAEDHAAYHHGELTDLAPFRADGGAWYTYALRDRRTAKTQLVLSGVLVDDVHGDGAGREVEAVLDLTEVMAVLAATSTPEARAVLVKLLSEVDR